MSEPRDLDDLATRLEGASERYGQASFNHGCAIHEIHGNDRTELRKCQDEVGNAWVVVDDLIQTLRAWQAQPPAPPEPPAAPVVTISLSRDQAERLLRWSDIVGTYGFLSSEGRDADIRVQLKAALARETTDGDKG